MDAFIGEIRMFGGTFAPEGWAFCFGQLLSINDYPALFSLLGTTYGGDGRNTFGLPDLQGRIPIGYGQGPGLTARYLGQKSGQEIVSLQQNELPAHVHSISNNTASSGNGLTVSGTASIKCSSSAGDTQESGNSFFAETKGIGGDKIYTADPTKATSLMNSSVIGIDANVQGDVQVDVSSFCSDEGQSDWHNNMQPFLALNYIIALEGEYPSRS